MRLGIDLDHTLIDYRDLMLKICQEQGWLRDSPADKDAIKAALRSSGPQGEERWLELQAQSYGPRLFEARLYPGALNTVQKLQERGHEIWIVSHKTSHAAAAPEIELHEQALAFLSRSGLGVPASRVKFEPTRRLKIERIQSLSLDVFLDDLAEVLADPGFPTSCYPLWFRPVKAGAAELLRIAAWPELERFVELCESGKRSLSPAAVGSCWRVLGEAPAGIEPLQRAGNSRIYQVLGNQGQKLAAKLYPGSSSGYESRLDREFNGLSALWSAGFRDVPQPLARDARNQVGVYAWIEGRATAESQASSDLARACANFISRLIQNGNRGQLSALGPATDSRMKLGDYSAAIDSRLRAMDRRLCAEATELLDSEFEPLRQLVVRRFQAELTGVDLDRILPREKQIPSPSDFGPHNLLVKADRSYVFLDFEYFGWDDPAKLLSDFMHSVAHDLPAETRWEFFDVVLPSLPFPSETAKRFRQVVDLVGLEWVLIVLNVLDPRVLARRRLVEPQLDDGLLIQRRLKQARSMLRAFRQRSGQAGFLTLQERSA